MTVSSLTREARTLCNGVTRAFPVPFQFILPADLVVRLVDIASMAETVLAEGADYVLTGDGRAGTATVQTVAAYPAGLLLSRRRETALAQTADYVPNDGFPAESHERQLDRLTMVDQEQKEDHDALAARSFLAPRGETPGPVPRLPLRRDRLAIFNAAGDLDAMAGGNALVALTPAGRPFPLPLFDTMRTIGTEIADDGHWGGAFSADDGVWG